jgi:hypothetical protein
LVPEDLEQILRYFSIWKDQSIQEIALLSPCEEQYQLIKKLFPKAHINVYTIRNWNLDYPNKRHYDLICAMNVFHYSKTPPLWFENVLNACRYFWLQDLVNRYRSDKRPCQLGDDGDSMRYCFSPNIHSTFDGAFDLSVFKEKITDFHAYPTEGGNMHFLCSMKGKASPEDVQPTPKVFSIINSLRVEIVFKLKKIGKSIIRIRLASLKSFHGTLSLRIWQDRNRHLPKQLSITKSRNSY